MPDQMAQLEQVFTLHRLDQATDPVSFLKERENDIRGAVTTTLVGIDNTTIERLPRLEIIASMGVGYDKIDLGTCLARNVAVTNTPDVLNDDVADLALGLILMTRRRMLDGHLHVTSGEWKKGPLRLASSLKGKNLGILGLGRIGLAVALRCEPIGMQIGYTARSEKRVPYTYFQSPRALAEWSDVLVVTVPGGAETRAIVDKNVIESLGADGTLISIARGETVDEPALIEALQSGKLGSAGLDVYLNEPKPDQRLLTLPNVVHSPHFASATVETRRAMAQLVVENLIAHFEGKPLPTPVELSPKTAAP
jgi:lactate dehydrogenase-like 2-hydroxyacid dehydrogenase